MVGRVGTAAAVALLAIALGAGSVLAETELGHKGKVGPHQLNDSPANPIRCIHESAVLTSIEVGTVSIWSRDTSAGPDRRKVGWLLAVERQLYQQTEWQVIYRSPVRTAPAWNDQ